MRFSTLFASVGLVGSAIAGIVPRSYRVPAANGFPNPDASQEKQIAIQAGGKLPGAPLPTTLGDGSATAFQLIAFNELFETAYFCSLLYNVTNKIEGYKVEGDKFHEATHVLKTVLAVSTYP